MANAFSCQITKALSFCALSDHSRSYFLDDEFARVIIVIWLNLLLAWIMAVTSLKSKAL